MPFRNELKRPDLKGTFRCTVCQKIFCHSSSLSRHRMQAHFRSYTCTLCNKEIASNETLRAHMYKQHSISRMFMCRCCNWAFPDKTSLHMHMQTMAASGQPGQVNIIAKTHTCGGRPLSSLHNGLSLLQPHGGHAANLVPRATTAVHQHQHQVHQPAPLRLTTGGWPLDSGSGAAARGPPSSPAAAAAAAAALASLPANVRDDLLLKLRLRVAMNGGAGEKADNDAKRAAGGNIGGFAAAAAAAAARANLAAWLANLPRTQQAAISPGKSISHQNRPLTADSITAPKTAIADKNLPALALAQNLNSTSTRHKNGSESSADNNSDTDGNVKRLRLCTENDRGVGEHDTQFEQDGEQLGHDGHTTTPSTGNSPARCQSATPPAISANGGLPTTHKIGHPSTAPLDLSGGTIVKSEPDPPQVNVATPSKGSKDDTALFPSLFACLGGNEKRGCSDPTVGAAGPHSSNVSVGGPALASLAALLGNTAVGSASTPATAAGTAANSQSQQHFSPSDTSNSNSASPGANYANSDHGAGAIKQCTECQVLNGKLALTSSRNRFLEARLNALQTDLSRVQSRMSSLTAASTRTDADCRQLRDTADALQRQLLLCQEKTLRCIQSCTAADESGIQQKLLEILQTTFLG